MSRRFRLNNWITYFDAHQLLLNLAQNIGDFAEISAHALVWVLLPLIDDLPVDFYVQADELDDVSDFLERQKAVRNIFLGQVTFLLIAKAILISWRRR